MSHVTSFVQKHGPGLGRSPVPNARPPTPAGAYFTVPDPLLDPPPLDEPPTFLTSGMKTGVGTVIFWLYHRIRSDIASNQLKGSLDNIVWRRKYRSFEWARSWDRQVSSSAASSPPEMWTEMLCGLCQDFGTPTQAKTTFFHHQQHRLRVRSESEDVRAASRAKQEEYALCVAASLTEERLRSLELRFHNLQSKYDTSVSGTESSSPCRPSRNSGWSSTIRMRIFSGSTVSLGCEPGPVCRHRRLSHVTGKAGARSAGCRLRAGR